MALRFSRHWGLVILTCGVAAGAFDTLQAQRARIKFKTELADLGNLQVGEVVEYLFEFTNVGDAPLKIFDTWGD